MAIPASKSTPLVVHPKTRMHGEDRHRQLLNIAIQSFAQKGFSGTKTKDIAAAAGVSEAILFRHFASKEDLYHAILDTRETQDGSTLRIRDLEVLAERRDDRALFLKLGLAIVDSFRDDPAFQRLVLYASLEGHLLASLFRERFALPMGNFLRRYIALRQKEGVFQKCDPTVAMMFACGVFVQYAMARHLFAAEEPPLPDETVVKQMVTVILRGLAKGPREVPGKQKKGNHARL
jgi:TetR/AcrR family transcriptional regulator